MTNPASDPTPDLASLDAILGTELMTCLVCAKPDDWATLPTSVMHLPEPLVARLAWLMVVVGHLSGSYDREGIRFWFVRPRAALGGKAPAELLDQDWSPDQIAPARVLALAAAGRDLIAT